MKKFWTALLLSLACLTVALVWEYSLNMRTPKRQLASFESRLHAEEKIVDKLLESLNYGESIHNFIWKKKNIVLVGFKNKQLIFWNDERIGTPRLYEKLVNGGNFIKINNVFYDVRRRNVDDIEYFALLMIKEDYPYDNQYLTNRFNKSLGVNLNNVDKIIIYEDNKADKSTIYNRDGERLFQVESDMEYNKTFINYFVLIFYFLFFYLLFYVFKYALDLAKSFRWQILYSLLFFILILGLRFVMVRYHLPGSLYSMSIFRVIPAESLMLVSVGDLFITMFCIGHFLFISLNKFKIRYKEKRLVRYRNLFLTAFVLASFLYANFLHFAISSLIENTWVSMNIARLIDIDFASLISFITLVIGGMGLIVLISSSVRYFYNLFSIFEVSVRVMIVLLVCAIFCVAAGSSFSPLECLFLICIYFLFILSIYTVKADAQRSIYIITMILVAVYIIYLSKQNEVSRELSIRAQYANDIIRESDPAFEELLMGIEDEIIRDKKLDTLVHLRNDSVVTEYIANELLDMTGYYYNCLATLCAHGDSTHDVTNDIMVSCRDYYDGLIDSLGIHIGNTSFYNIKKFDGYKTYVGRFVYPDPNGTVFLYLRFDADDYEERSGYKQILSRIPQPERTVVYPYSYAKYVNGVLVSQRGNFNYLKSVEGFEDYSHVKEEVKNGYSHLIIPVEEDGVFVISLDEDVFALYYLNVLYAIFVFGLLSSYSLFFQFYSNDDNNKNSLKVRIKSNIIVLMFVLLLIMTFMSIVMNAISFENRHSAKVVQASKYLRNELEKYDCIDPRICPEIVEVFEVLSRASWMDLNIYNWKGSLIASSEPMIFEKGLDGTLLNPDAKKKMIDQNAMSFVQRESIGDLDYISTYIPLVIKSGERYVLNIPYFSRSDELNKDILLIVVIAVNIAMIMMMIAVILSNIVAERVTKPLQLVYEKLRMMRIGGRNERINYNEKDEVGLLVKEYNGMVEKLEENVKKLAKSERENAWREMARQIAHEIKNPLTPMKLNLQFLQRALQSDDPEEIKRRFKDISSVLIEQIDHMASIANAFSDFAKVQIGDNELFDLSELVNHCITLFKENVSEMNGDVEDGILIYADKEQVNRVIINLLKNAVQSIPEDRESKVSVKLQVVDERIILTVKDNGTGIPEENRDKIFEPNFTTKTGGMGLGLAMSNKIIQSMGGKITFESVENEGTEFFVIFKYPEE